MGRLRCEDLYCVGLDCMVLWMSFFEWGSLGLLGLLTYLLIKYDLYWSMPFYCEVRRGEVFVLGRVICCLLFIPFHFSALLCSALLPFITS